MNEEFEFETLDEQPSLLETEEAEFRRNVPIVRDHRSAVTPGAGVRWQPPVRTSTPWPTARISRPVIRPAYTTQRSFQTPYRSWPVVRPGYTQQSYPRPGYTQRSYPRPGYTPWSYPRPGYSQWSYPRPGYSRWSYPRPGYAARPPYWRQPAQWRPGYPNAPWYWQRRNPFAPGQGTRDEQIRWVQYFLNRVLNQNLPVDGVMSPATRTAVRNFQQRYGLPITGYVGPDTQQTMVATTSADSGMQMDPGGDMLDAGAPNQGVDASDAPGGVAVGATPQIPPGADADAHELLAEYGLPLGEFELESEFENWETGLHSEFEMEAAAPTPQRSTFALLRAIPDDPDYQKYVPIEYRLNAKKIIGEVAQDLKSNGEKAQFIAETGHFGLMAAEIFAEGSLLVGGLAIAAPVLALVAGGLALGAPYYEAGQEIAANWAATGFSRGVVMGADRRSAKLVKDYFGNLFFSPNRFHPQGASIAAANHRMGLLVGYIHGRMLSKNQHAIFWHDLGHRMGDQSYRGPSEQWNRSQWIDWYLTSAAIFRRDHLDK